jgi:hypothetical protein
MLALCLILLPIRVSAQEWNVSLGAGSSALKYQFEQGSVKSGFGGLILIGVGYTAFFSQNIGLTFGLEGAMYGSSTSIDGISFSNRIATPTGLSGSFYLKSDFSGFEEKQSAMMLQIPVMLQFQMPIMGEETAFFAGAGVKIGFPVSAKWEQTIEQVVTRGYSDYTNQTYENMSEHGFMTQYRVGTSDKLSFGTPVFAALETGLKFKTSAKTSVYAGLYLDLGLNSILKPAEKNLIEYNAAAPENYVFNSLLQTSSVTSVKPFAVGVKVRMAFGTGKDAVRGKSSAKKTLKAAEEILPAKLGDGE